MYSTRFASLLALLPLLAAAQECPGTTYSSLCCHGTLVGSSVALPPASTFPLSPPPTSTFTASNNFNLPLHSKSLPSDFSFITPTGGLQGRADPKQVVITSGVTCQGSVATLGGVSSETGTDTRSAASTSSLTTTKSATLPTTNTHTTTPSTTGSSLSSSASSTSTSASATAASASSSNTSTAGAAATTFAMAQKLGVGLGLVLGLL